MSKTCFKGTINGQEFDNVRDYNIKMQELLEAGVAVNASSSTVIAAAEDTEVATDDEVTCAGKAVAEAEEYSYYPYMDDDDPFYLDLLVTHDSEINKEALDEMRKEFGRCYKAIINAIADKDVCVDSLKEYRSALREIIDNVKNDKQCTLNAIQTIKNRKDELDREYKRYMAEYETEMDAINSEMQILEDAKPVIKEFIDFYENLEADVINEIKSRPCACGKNCDPDCNCDCHNVSRTDKVTTAVEEAEPQKTYELSDILEHIFGTNVFSNRRRSLR
jgi:sugar-specific transcriptional regulator TrmB